MHANAAAAFPPAASGGTDTLGCLSQKLQHDQALAGSDLQFYRKSSAGADDSQVLMPASHRGYLVGISLCTGHRRRIFNEYRATTHDFEIDSIYIRNFLDDYKADFYGHFDFILLEVSRAFIERTSSELGRSRVRELRGAAGERDQVLAHLAQAVVPALSRPGMASRLFVDQLGIAIGTYLVEQYGNGQLAAPKTNRLLSQRCVAMAKEMLIANIDGDLSIAAIADACNLSRSHFTRAFRDTTGQTPHQWLVAQRLERARALLRDSALPLAEVATTCGFADQSHFTRVFSQALGVSPGIWRRGVGC